MFFLLVGNPQYDSLHKKHMSKCVLDFKVIPEASTTEFADFKAEVIRVRVAAPPEGKQEVDSLHSKEIRHSKNDRRFTFRKDL